MGLGRNQVSDPLCHVIQLSGLQIHVGGSAVVVGGAAHFLKIATMQKPRVFKRHEGYKT